MLSASPVGTSECLASGLRNSLFWLLPLSGMSLAYWRIIIFKLVDLLGTGLTLTEYTSAPAPTATPPSELSMGGDWYIRVPSSQGSTTSYKHYVIAVPETLGHSVEKN